MQEHLCNKFKHVIELEHINKCKKSNIVKQAGAELGQAQPKLGLRLANVIN